MNRYSFAAAAGIALFLLAAASAQTPAPGQAGAPSAADNAWLTDARKIYYSSIRAGLKGFNCDVRPDWRTLLVSANGGAEVADDDPRMALLKDVKVRMHARMSGGGSTIEWTAGEPGQPADDASAALLEAMHRTVSQTLEGFLQFWMPFIENQEVPETAAGVEISHTGSQHTIHAKEGATELTEIFDEKLVLQQFNVNLSGLSIKFFPAFEPTPEGLLVSAFDAHILPAGSAVNEQRMHVSIHYQSIDRLVIPSELNMNVVGTGTFHYIFSGCAANPKQD